MILNNRKMKTGKTWHIHSSFYVWTKWKIFYRRCFECSITWMKWDFKIVGSQLLRLFYYYYYSLLLFSDWFILVSQSHFCPLCIVTGSQSVKTGQMLKELFETPYFRCAVVSDTQTVESCGALKVQQKKSEI